MSFFADNYRFLSFPVATPGAPGFREAQRGALFAIGAHFSGRTEPAVVTMPTGSGKTAVLQAAALLLRAGRVLVVTPSRLVREQIAEDFKTLGILRRISAVDDHAGNPSVAASSARVTDAAGWQAMRTSDVVVATVPSLSGNGEEDKAPEDLFDLILVDEAHHSPATTWAALFRSFPKAKRVLFTATPFRRDRREIEGRFVYTYDLKRAYDDRVFGHINYQLVPEPQQRTAEASDVAIAKATEHKFALDRAQGFEHLVMVRTDSRTRASELEAVYATHTGLRLKLIHGAHSLSYVRKVLKGLDEGNLDGIICVNMLGEGFDMPRLKIAAVHSPHRSLAVTLQFIGRFARTSGSGRLGPATFLATRSGVSVEAERLYAEGAVWSEIVPNLAETRIRKEVETRETLATFDLEVSALPDLSDLSLYTLSPYAHAKIYRLKQPFDLLAQPSFGRDRELVFGRVSVETNSSIYITRKTSQAPWSTNDKLVDVRFDLFIFVYVPAASLLFVCASKRSDGLYRRIVRDLVGYDPKILGLTALNRALRDLEQTRFFNIGMRNRQHSSLTESYKQITGPRADEAIREEDARLYHRGHCFGSAKSDGVDVTIGLSSASKIWSNTSLSLPDLLTWCGSLAAKINDGARVDTGSRLDLLAMGEHVTSIRARVLWAEWEKDIYIDPPQAAYKAGVGCHQRSLTELDLEVDSSSATDVLLAVRGHGFEARLAYRVGDEAHFSYVPGSPTIDLARGRDVEDLIDYLNDNPLNLMLDDWTRICGDELFGAPSAPVAPFDARRVEAVDWQGAGVDPTIEFAGRGGTPSPVSIQTHLARELTGSGPDVVFWDHGSGEAADFITVTRLPNGGADVVLYHCKGSGGANAGNRVDDVYEVCGQAVKSAIWCDLPRLVAKLKDRHARRIGVATFLTGDAAALDRLVASRPVRFEMVVVQPGVSRSSLEPKLAEVLGAAVSHLIRAGHREMRVIGSA